MSISYEDFANLEIKIGTITAAEVVTGADQLLQLTVDVGEDAPRQIIAGIRSYIENPETLVGKQCPFLVNLAPRTIRGLESQGMILAGGGGASPFTLLHPGTAVPPGTLIQ